jgi:hypothetical protein
MSQVRSTLLWANRKSQFMLCKFYQKTMPTTSDNPLTHIVAVELALVMMEQAPVVVQITWAKCFRATDHRYMKV